MNFREYFKLTKETSKNCLKICGVIFTSIYAIIALITGYKNVSFADSIEIFVLCFLLGNGFGLLIWALAITSSYGQIKSMIKKHLYHHNPLVRQGFVEVLTIFWTTSSIGCRSPNCGCLMTSSRSGTENMPLAIPNRIDKITNTHACVFIQTISLRMLRRSGKRSFQQSVPM